MVFRSSERMDWPVITAIIITIVLIVVGLVVFVVRPWVAKDNGLVIPTSPATSLSVVTDPNSLIDKYKLTLEDFRDQLVDDDRSAVDLRSHAEDLLFLVRVPQPYLDVHFQAVVSVRELGGQIDAISAESMRSQLDSLFITLLNSLP